MYTNYPLHPVGAYVKCIKTPEDNRTYTIVSYAETLGCYKTNSLEPYPRAMYMSFTNASRVHLTNKLKRKSTQTPIDNRLVEALRARLQQDTPPQRRTATTRTYNYGDIIDSTFGFNTFYSMASTPLGDLQADD